MKRIVHRSVIPIYAAAGAWLICALALPMYRLWQYLLYGALTAGVYFAARHFFPGTVEEVAAPAPPPDSGDPEVDRLILQGREQLKELAALGNSTGNQTLKARCGRLEALGGKIFAALEEDTSRLPQTRKFLNYYLPATVGLLRRYRALEDQQAQGENISTAMGRIEDMTEKVETAFQTYLDKLYAAEAMDVTADIQVMQQMMAAEGLLEQEM